MTPYSLVDSTNIVAGAISSKNAGTRFLQNVGNIYQTLWCHTENDSILDTDFCKDLKSHNAEYADIP
jgi:hypothetical protein